MHSIQTQIAINRMLQIAHCHRLNMYVNPLKISPEYTWAEDYGKCVL